MMTLYRYIKADELKSYKIDKGFRIKREEFSKFLNRLEII
jgi:excisionase family DNA binding protein